ncbi:hypothetical protein [Stieleria varia]|uniref:Uncharacterized protein n=1 Tax=Stieleria varia TaxID=2528005 RepID=A0A5C6AZD6_9BACT|nr:hypothetical protein [Stieleria varia]TWU04857.1 hypothetical protein Pla52n_29020 [Stieleria varia]
MAAKTIVDPALREGLGEALRDSLNMPTQEHRQHNGSGRNGSGSGFRTGILIALSAMLGVVAIIQTGCLGMYANLAHAVGADMAPAAYEGLKGCKVAVVTLTDSSPYSNDVSARILSRNVSMMLTDKVKKIELVREEEIAEYRDEHGWDAIDFQSIGSAVGAEKVVAIELTNLKLRDGKTLYRGRCDVHLTVLDAETGKVEFERDIEEFTYPVNSGQYTSETTEVKFRKLYLGIVAKQIAKNFFAYDPHEDFAMDTIIAR